MTTPTWYSKPLADNTFATAAQAVPTGGTTGQILAKSSGTDYAVEWIDPSAAQVQPDWDATSGMGQILNKPTLGTAAAQDVSAFATAAQGVKADNAVPQAVASGASPIRIVGYGTSQPASAQAGDVFLLLDS